MNGYNLSNTSHKYLIETYFANFLQGDEGILGITGLKGPKGSRVSPFVLIYYLIMNNFASIIILFANLILGLIPDSRLILHTLKVNNYEGADSKL